MQVLQTRDYAIFKSINSNREVDAKHVKKLVAAIRLKNLLHLNPISVNKEMQVIDGQHRLEAATILQLPIYYVIDSSITNNDIAMLNSNKKNWQLEYYLNFYVVEGKEEYKKLSTFLNKYPKITLTIAIGFFESRTNTKSLLDDFRAGEFRIENGMKAYRIGEILQKLEQYGTFIYQVSFIRAITTVSSLENFEISVLLHQIEQQQRSFVKCIDRKQYTDMLLELYNFRRHGKNRINL